VGVGVVLIVGGVLGVRAYQRAQHKPIGVPCTMTAGIDNESETYIGCGGGLCIRETDDTAYCSEECKDDSECPERYVCEPTRSRRRRACMEEGADITPLDAGAEVARTFRRKR